MLRTSVGIFGLLVVLSACNNSDEKTPQGVEKCTNTQAGEFR